MPFCDCLTYGVQSHIVVKLFSIVQSRAIETVNEFITFEAIIKVWKENNGDVAANRQSPK